MRNLSQILLDALDSRRYFLSALQVQQNWILGCEPTHGTGNIQVWYDHFPSMSFKIDQNLLHACPALNGCPQSSQEQVIRLRMIRPVRLSQQQVSFLRRPRYRNRFSIPNGARLLILILRQWGQNRLLNQLPVCTLLVQSRPCCILRRLLRPYKIRIGLCGRTIACPFHACSYPAAMSSNRMRQDTPSTKR